MARGRQARDLALVGASAVCVLVAAALASKPGQGDGPSASPQTAGELGSLPPGAERSPAPPALEGAGAGCDFADRGFGDYERWRPLPLGRALVPEGRALGEDGAYNLLVHFHGAEPIRKELAPEGLDLVIVGVDVGVRSGAYQKTMAPAGAWEALRASIDREVAAASGSASARARHVIVSSWSAGFGAVQAILERPDDRPHAVILLDSLYGGYLPGKLALEHGQLPAFVRAARAAKEGEGFFAMTSTDVPTEGYASTAETADFLLRELGLQPNYHPVDPAAASPLLWSVEAGGFFAQGYGGSSREAHCDQLRALGLVLRDRVLPALGG